MNELLKEKNDEEMKLNSERFKNFETYMVANDYTAQIRNLKEESTIIRNFNENFKKQIVSTFFIKLKSLYLYYILFSFLFVIFLFRKNQLFALNFKNFRILLITTL
jgi:hypothetical protein